MGPARVFPEQAGETMERASCQSRCARNGCKWERIIHWMALLVSCMHALVTHCWPVTTPCTAHGRY